MENIYDLLDKLAMEIGNSKRGVFSDKKIIDGARCIEIINAIENSLPQEIKEASYIVKNREETVRNAKEQSERILSDAERRAREILSDNAIIEEARAQADSIVREAEEYGGYLETESKKRIDAMFIEVERALSEALDVIRSCREDLTGSMIRRGER